MLFRSTIVSASSGEEALKTIRELKARGDALAILISDQRMFAPHYDRHVWIYRENPNGVFTPFNPAVSCAHHHGSHGHAMHSTH